MRAELFVIGLCVVAAGCNADPRCRRETALLRAEILDLEDKYYQTKAQRDDALAALESGGNITAAKKIGRPLRGFRSGISHEINPQEVIYSDEIYDGGVISESPAYSTNGLPDSNVQPFDYAPHGFAPTEAPTANPRNQVPPKTDDSIPILLDGPEVISPLESEGIVPSGSPPSDPTTVPASPASSILLIGPNANTANPSVVSSQAITEIVIDRTQTRGHDVDGRPGDDGLDVLLRPRSANGETQLQSGELTVSIIDPSAPTATQRIGLWKFLPSEAELFFTDISPEKRGILLHLPWEKTTPVGKEVVVFVRFQTSDGRRLETTSKVRVAPPLHPATDGSLDVKNDSDLIAGWINRDSQRSGQTANAPNASPFANRPNTLATPISSGAKPNWRPVR